MVSTPTPLQKCGDLDSDTNKSKYLYVMVIQLPARFGRRTCCQQYRWKFPWYTCTPIDHTANTTAKSSSGLRFVHRNMLPTLPPKVPVAYIFYIRTRYQRYHRNSLDILILHQVILLTLLQKFRWYAYSTSEHVFNGTISSRDIFILYQVTECSRDILILHQVMSPTVPPKVLVTYVFCIKTCYQQYQEKFPWYTNSTSRRCKRYRRTFPWYEYSISGHVTDVTGKRSRDMNILYQDMLPTVPANVPVIWVFCIKTCCQRYRQTFPWN
jgi:hypothetical protein